MIDKQIRTVPLGDMDAVYITNNEGQVSFCIIPASFGTAKWENKGADPLVQISSSGDASVIGFAAGQTRHNSALTMSFKFVSQDVARTDDNTVITTVLEGPEGLILSHMVKAHKCSRAVRIHTEITNSSEEEVMIEALSSACISYITPYADDEATGRLVLHRFRSRWSAEARHSTDSIEDLMLEPSWARFGVRCEKFGTVGSMPIRGFFPFAAIEDKESKVIWAMTLACSSSWQIEAVRIDEGLSITAGLADYEYGHWRKALAPKESFVTPECFVTVCTDGFDSACERLLDEQKISPVGKTDNKNLPLFFNEYCTTWGEPDEEKIDKILPLLKGKGYDYFVIDAGWYADSTCGWQDNMGDWIVADHLFPNGIKAVVDKINKAGMKAGIWFELEVVGKDAKAAGDIPHLLTRDGKVIISGTRRFWDMRSEWVIEYLTDKVIKFLNDNGFEYIKIDYNDTIGIGCDGDESYGEGLRQCMEATKAFFAKIKKEAPQVAIELCSSGGHRLEPSFMALADYLSFSDAHEEKEIPVIAASLQKLILPSKSQIWSVLRKDDPLKRIVYSICAGMYGTLCISGDVSLMSKEQWEITDKGTAFYKKATEVIADGFTKMYGPFQTSNRALKGYQASVRYDTKGRALAVVHVFETDGKIDIDVPVRSGYQITDIYETGDHDIKVTGSGIRLHFDEQFDAVAILLSKEGID